LKMRIFRINSIIWAIIIWASIVGTSSAKIEGVNIFNHNKYNIETIRIGNITYISLTDFNRLINSRLKWDPFSATATIDAGETIIKITMYSPYVIVGDKVYNLIYRSVFQDGALFVPLKEFVDLSNNILSGELIYYPDRKRLDYLPRLYNILDLNSEQKTNGYLITIFLSKTLKYDYILTDEGWLNITIYGGKVDTSKMVRYDLKPAVKSILAYQFEKSAQLSFRLKNRKASITINSRENPDRITVSINTSTNASLSAIPTWRKNKIELIVIDPGHGGQDDGAVGRKYHTKEKDVALDISKRLAKILKKKGLRVELTREKDVFIPLGERTKFANRIGADLFVSIHANASPKASPRGSETFFLARAKNDEARAVAALENSAIRFEETDNSAFNKKDDLSFILMDIVQNEYLKESSDLSETIQRHIKRNVDIPDRGIDQAGFYVLNNAFMPAVLVETAFISNPKEEKLLRKSSFRQKMAEGIAAGILDFKQKYQYSGKK